MRLVVVPEPWSQVNCIESVHREAKLLGRCSKPSASVLKQCCKCFSVPMPAEPDTAGQKITEVVPTVLSPALFGSASLC